MRSGWRERQGGSDEMGAIADDSFMGSLIGTGHSLSNLELVSSSPFHRLSPTVEIDGWAVVPSYFFIVNRGLAIKILCFVAVLIC